jgi:DNA-binding XRE family transcriptional regulator
MKFNFPMCIKMKNRNPFRRGCGENRGGKGLKNTLPLKRRQEIGSRVRAVRKSLKLEQTEQAKKMGLSQAIISQYEKGLTEIPLSFIGTSKRSIAYKAIG